MESDLANTGLGVVPDMGPLMLKSFLMLALVLVILLAVVWLLKKFGPMRQLGKGSMTVRSTCHLGQKERLMVVDAEGVRLLLGVTASGISTLHNYGPVEETAEEPATPKPLFESIFKKEMKKEAAGDA